MHLFHGVGKGKSDRQGKTFWNRHHDDGNRNDQEAQQFLNNISKTKSFVQDILKDHP